MRATVMSVYEAAATGLSTVCPVAPPGAQVQVDKITGYVLWAVLALSLIHI